MASSSKDLPAAGPGAALTSFTGKSASHKNDKVKFRERQCLNEFDEKDKERWKAKKLLFRIQTDVLSITAQEILTLQRGVQVGTTDFQCSVMCN